MEKISCVYKIVNKVNGSFYIGSAVDFNRRIRRHLLFLKNGTHHSTKLQRSFNKHGEDNFSFEILEIVADTTKLIECEQKWIDELKPTYNMTLIAGLNSHLGMKRSDETRDKIRKALSGRKLTAEHIAACVKGREDYIVSDETKDKMRVAANEFWSNIDEDEVNARVMKSKNTRINNGGYVVTEEMKNQISETLKNKEDYHGGHCIEVEKYDLEHNLLETYPSFRVAEKMNSITSGYLSNRIKQNINLIKGFIWKLKQ